MSYRAYHDYDDDRDVITCGTLSDTRPMPRKDHTLRRPPEAILSARSTRHDANSGDFCHFIVEQCHFDTNNDDYSRARTTVDS